ncbi:MAG TPA: isopentenyl phosphate kinase [Aggregatilineales bacterium]|nr:isopentenyl phosphate kinase [Aggregatilineales bacterium]
MLIFIKLGGSLITDKTVSQEFHADVMRRTAAEIARARARTRGLKLVIGHGSGSFGHVAASKYDTVNGVHTPDQWRGFAEVAVIARRLNGLVVEALFEAGLPVFPVQPSSSACSTDGEITALDEKPVRWALDQDLIPVVYGDVAFDAVRGGTILSTEPIFAYLAERLLPQKLFLLGEVEGVYDSQKVVIPKITMGSFDRIAGSLGGSRGTDVTGGMASKVRQMLDLTARVPGLQVRIFGGTLPGQLESALGGEAELGTLITG